MNSQKVTKESHQAAVIELLRRLHDGMASGEYPLTAKTTDIIIELFLDVVPGAREAARECVKAKSNPPSPGGGVMSEKLAEI